MAARLVLILKLDSHDTWTDPLTSSVLVASQTSHIT